MRQWITTIVLGLLLVGGGVFCGTKIVDMTGQLNELELSYTILESDYNSLESNHKSLELDYAVLQSKHTALESNYGSLEISYESLHSDYDLLQGKMAELQSAYGKLEAENENLEGLLQPNLILFTPQVAGLKITVNGVVIPAISTDEIDDIYWDWGDGSSEGNGFPATHKYAKGGTYTITVTAYDSNGISATKTTIVTI